MIRNFSEVSNFITLIIFKKNRVTEFVYFCLEDY